MFAKTIIDSDAFLDMPVTSQLLYFHLSMRADDDGFVNKPRSIMRMVGAKEDDAKILVSKKFILPFDSGVIVIKHWRIHNYIRKDTYTETKYKDEKSTLELDENDGYRIRNESVTNLLRNVYETETQVRLGKDSIGKDNTSCAESETSAPQVIEFDCVKGEKYGVDQKQIDEWSQTYPAIDVLMELRKMKSWLQANSTKIKTKSGMPRFCVNWLSKAQNQGGSGKVADWHDRQVQSGRIVDRLEPSTENQMIKKSNKIKLKRGDE